jgi:inhibitor of cysteine peptidase
VFRKAWFFGPILIGTVLLTSCSTLVSPQPAASPKKLTDKDTGSTVVIKVGQTLEVALQGNPTTGYIWEAAPDSAALLSPQGELQFKPDNNLIGSGGIVTLRFTALQPGEASLKLIYHRPWETNVPPIKTFEIKLIVTK